MLFKKALRKKSKLRLGITGPAGSGKTYGALLIAFGLGGNIALIDSENGSGDLYSSLGNYDIGYITAPYDVKKYIQAIHDAENSGYDIIIIDSLSHAWSGQGGLLDWQSKIVETSKNGNSYTAWRQVTPWHNKLIDTMLASSAHIIATMRSKTEYVQVQNDKGRTEIRKVGLAPVQREGMDYEFSTVFDLNVNHIASVSKDRTGIFDEQIFTISQDTGRILRTWLEEGFDQHKVNSLYKAFCDKFNGDNAKAKDIMQSITNGKCSKDWNSDDINRLQEALISDTTPEQVII